MHVVQISFFVDQKQRPPDQLLDDWFSLSDIAGAVSEAGATATVIVAHRISSRIDRDNVSYRFISPDSKTGRLTANPAFGRLLEDLGPDVFHVHGLGFSDEVVGLKKLMPEIPILLQDHAERLPRIWHRRRWRRGVAPASGISFCAREQVEPFRRAGLIDPGIKTFEIPESTTSFRPGDPAAARSLTGVTGDPAVLWTGHLNRNKDPLTVLGGISRSVPHLNDLQLWCCYGSAPLMSTVKARIAGDPALRDRVHLLGRVPHSRVEQLMQAADLFVLGSHREGSGFSVIEAIATGLEPVVTNIPSLRALTSNGSIGELWSCGDTASLANALVRAAQRPRDFTRERVRRHFETQLSPRALGERLVAAYQDLMDGEFAVSEVQSPATGESA